MSEKPVHLSIKLSDFIQNRYRDILMKYMLKDMDKYLDS